VSAVNAPHAVDAAVSDDSAASLDRLEEALGYRFADRGLLELALTHASYAYEKGLPADNEQLGFLGDAILGFLVRDLLCREHPACVEGRLSQLKAFFVSAANLVICAERIGLGDRLRLGKGEEKSGGRKKPALLVNALEAILGAIFRDGGVDAARRTVEAFWLAPIRGIAGDREICDSKTALQEILQSKGLGRARYAVTAVAGPDHQKVFTVEIRIADRPAAYGVALTKKAAEQAAAGQALEALLREDTRVHQ
jgi:ribonuclease-3